MPYSGAGTVQVYRLRRATYCAGSLLTVLASMPGIVIAQSPSSVEPGATHQAESEASSALEEVTVTARRRSEQISNVPISITAFDANTLAERTIRSESDLQIAVPGLIVRTAVRLAATRRYGPVTWV